MPTSLRRALATRLAPFRVRLFAARWSSVAGQVVGGAAFTPLPPAELLGTGRELLALRTSISPDWLPTLRDMAIPGGKGRVHAFPVPGLSAQMAQRLVPSLEADLVERPPLSLREVVTDRPPSPLTAPAANHIPLGTDEVAARPLLAMQVPQIVARPAPILTAELVAFPPAGSGDVYYLPADLAAWSGEPRSPAHMADAPPVRVDVVAMCGEHFGDRLLPGGAERTWRRHRRYRGWDAGGHQGTDAPPGLLEGQPDFPRMILPVLYPVLDFESDTPVSLPHPLYRFQRAGVRFLLERPKAVLNDDLGMGKTITTVVAMRRLFRSRDIRRALVIAPLNMLSVWEQHLAEWAPDLSVAVVHGRRRTRGRLWVSIAHVWLTTYRTLRMAMRRADLPATLWQEFDLVIADEVQRLGDPTAGRSRALCSLEPARRWGLSSTPLAERPQSAVSASQFLSLGMVDVADHPDVVPTVLAPYTLRRQRCEVQAELPRVTRQTVWLDLDPEQRHDYKAREMHVRREFAARLERGEEVSRVHVLDAVSELRRLCNFAPDRMHSPKSRALCQIVEELAASGGKVVVLTHYADEGSDKLEYLLERFGVARVDGSQSRRTRELEMSRFRTNSKVRVLLATLKAGGFGLSPNDAAFIVHFDQPGSVVQKRQTEELLQPAGPPAPPVTIYEFWMNGTIDEQIWEILQRKQALFESPLEGLPATVIEGSISDEEWLHVLGLGAGGGKWRPATRSARSSDGASQLDSGEILVRLRAMARQDFQQLVGELFRRLGYAYTYLKVPDIPGVDMIDVIAKRLTMDGPEVLAIQCRQDTGALGVRVLRDLVQAIASQPSYSKGILVTPGTLAPAAARFCDDAPSVDAIDGRQLAEYVREFGMI